MGYGQDFGDNSARQGDNSAPNFENHKSLVRRGHAFNNTIYRFPPIPHPSRDAAASTHCTASVIGAEMGGPLERLIGVGSDIATRGCGPGAGDPDIRRGRSPWIEGGLHLLAANPALSPGSAESGRFRIMRLGSDFFLAPRRWRSSVRPADARQPRLRIPRRKVFMLRCSDGSRHIEAGKNERSLGSRNL
jgi:hypothetical protein